MTRTAYVDPVGGVAGDMLLAALLDAGAPRSVLDDTVHALGLHDLRVSVRRVERAGLAATHVDVAAGAGRGRPARAMVDVVAAANLPAPVEARAVQAIDRIATAETAAHGVDRSEVVLHELGGDDTIVDICGAFALLHALGVEHVVSAPLPLGRGLATSDHGPIPTPAPATMELLRGVPVIGVATSEELVTPTGAAIVVTAADAFGELPPMTLGVIGTGAGARVHRHRPNVIRVIIGEAAGPPATDRDDVVVLEANLDDLLPELVPDVMAACFAAGAIDVWTTPIQMKKARPGLLVSVLARSGEERGLAETLLRHSSTLGVRVRHEARHELDRAFREVQVEGFTVRVKIGLFEGRTVNVAPEHDDCAAVATAVGRPVKQIWGEALAAATTGIAVRELDDHAR